MKNNILVISNLYPSTKDPFYGTFVKNFVDDISKSERIQKVDICVIKGRSYHLYTKIWKYLIFYLNIIHRLFFNKYDLVYVHIITHAALPLRFVSTFKKLPLIFNIHGEDLLTQTKLASKFLQLATPLLCQAKLIVVPSVFFQKKVKEVLPQIPDSKIYVSASGGVNEVFFNQAEKKINKTPIIGYVSRIDRGKGWDTFISALYLLKKKGIEYKAQIIGRGEEILLMEEMISTLKLEEKIKYVGPVEYKKLPNFYSTFDLFIFPTQLEESLGLVGLEAMACKAPVIGSNIGGLTDYIENGKNGYFFQPSDSAELAEKMILYLSLPKEKQQDMKNAAYQTALKYHANIVSEKLISKILS